MTAIRLIAIGRRLANIYAGLCAPICKKYGINQTSFDILLFCANNPEHNTARDLCATRGIKSGIASVSTDSLIENGFLLRTTDPHDRRIFRLTPTEKAAPIIDEGRKVQEYFTGNLKSGVTDDELAVLNTLVGKLESNLNLFGKENLS